MFRWSLPAQSFSGPSPLGLATVFYCLRSETSLFVASYDSQGHGGGIRPRLHTSEVNSHSRILLALTTHRRHTPSIVAWRRSQRNRVSHVSLRVWFVISTRRGADDTENTASSIVACWTMFTELLPDNALISPLQYQINRPEINVRGMFILVKFNSQPKEKTEEVYGKLNKMRMHYVLNCYSSSYRWQRNSRTGAWLVHIRDRFGGSFLFIQNCTKNTVIFQCAQHRKVKIYTGS
jgi:hypothetical protein